MQGIQERIVAKISLKQSMPAAAMTAAAMTAAAMTAT
jgi:hypothetical protein